MYSSRKLAISAQATAEAALAAADQALMAAIQLRAAFGNNLPAYAGEEANPAVRQFIAGKEQLQKALKDLEYMQSTTPVLSKVAEKHKRNKKAAIKRRSRRSASRPRKKRSDSSEPSYGASESSLKENVLDAALSSSKDYRRASRYSEETSDGSYADQPPIPPSANPGPAHSKKPLKPSHSVISNMGMDSVFTESHVQRVTRLQQYQEGTEQVEYHNDHQHYDDEGGERSNRRRRSAAEQRPMDASYDGHHDDHDDDDNDDDESRNPRMDSILASMLMSGVEDSSVGPLVEPPSVLHRPRFWSEESSESPRPGGADALDLSRMRNYTFGKRGSGRRSFDAAKPPIPSRHSSPNASPNASSTSGGSSRGHSRGASPLKGHGAPQGTHRTSDPPSPVQSPRGYRRDSAASHDRGRRGKTAVPTFTATSEYVGVGTPRASPRESPPTDAAGAAKGSRLQSPRRSRAASAHSSIGASSPPLPASSSNPPSRRVSFSNVLEQPSDSRATPSHRRSRQSSPIASPRRVASAPATPRGSPRHAKDSQPRSVLKSPTAGGMASPRLTSPQGAADSSNSGVSRGSSSEAPRGQAMGGSSNSGSGNNEPKEVSGAAGASSTNEASESARERAMVVAAALPLPASEPAAPPQQPYHKSPEAKLAKERQSRDAIEGSTAGFSKLPSPTGSQAATVDVQASAGGDVSSTSESFTSSALSTARASASTASQPDHLTAAFHLASPHGSFVTPSAANPGAPRRESLTLKALNLPLPYTTKPSPPHSPREGSSHRHAAGRSGWMYNPLGPATPNDRVSTSRRAFPLNMPRRGSAPAALDDESMRGLRQLLESNSALKGVGPAATKHADKRHSTAASLQLSQLRKDHEQTSTTEQGADGLTVDTEGNLLSARTFDDGDTPAPEAAVQVASTAPQQRQTSQTASDAQALAQQLSFLANAAKSNAARASQTLRDLGIENEAVVTDVLAAPPSRRTVKPVRSLSDLSDIEAPLSTADALAASNSAGPGPSARQQPLSLTINTAHPPSTTAPSSNATTPSGSPPPSPYAVTFPRLPPSLTPTGTQPPTPRASPPLQPRSLGPPPASQPQSEPQSAGPGLPRSRSASVTSVGSVAATPRTRQAVMDITSWALDGVLAAVGSVSGSVMEQPSQASVGPPSPTHNRRRYSDFTRSRAASVAMSIPEMEELQLEEVGSLAQLPTASRLEEATQSAMAAPAPPNTPSVAAGPGAANPHSRSPQLSPNPSHGRSLSPGSSLRRDSAGSSPHALQRPRSASSRPPRTSAASSSGSAAGLPWGYQNGSESAGAMYGDQFPEARWGAQAPKRPPEEIEEAMSRLSQPKDVEKLREKVVNQWEQRRSSETSKKAQVWKVSFTPTSACFQLATWLSLPVFVQYMEARNRTRKTAWIAAKAVQLLQNADIQVVKAPLKSKEDPSAEVSGTPRGFQKETKEEGKDGEAPEEDAPAAPAAPTPPTPEVVCSGRGFLEYKGQVFVVQAELWSDGGMWIVDKDGSRKRGFEGGAVPSGDGQLFRSRGPGGSNTTAKRRQWGRRVHRVIWRELEEQVKQALAQSDELVID